MDDNNEKEIAENPKKPQKKMDLTRILKLKGKGMTYKQIAEVIGTTEGVIRNTVYRAKLSKSSSTKRSVQGWQKKREQQEMERKMKLEKNLARIDELAKQYTHDRKNTTTAMAEKDAGRAASVNMFIGQCIGISTMVDINDINSLYAGFGAYVRLCTESDIPMAFATACLALGVSGNQIGTWKTGKVKDQEYKTFAESVYYAIHAGIESCMAVGLINPIVGIWWEKSVFKMIEAQHAAPEEENPMGQRRTAEQIAADYDEVPLPD